MKRLLPMILVATVLACSSPAADDASSDSSEQVVNVYSARHYDTDDSIYEQFLEETGIRVNLIEGDSAALLERLTREGAESPADVFITVDAGRLYQAEQQGVFASVQSAVLEERVPESLRHPQGLWFGLTKRARIIVVSKDRVEPGAISSYEDLADERWRGKVLIRSSSNVYNQSLMGSIIAALGEEAAETWCEGLVANFARTPQGGDRDQIRSVAAGEGDIAVVNSYYLARMITGSDEDREAASKVAVVFPNQGGRGTHVNISGAGVVEGSAHPDNAIRFIEYLASPQAQTVFAGGNKEYPVAAGYEAVAELVEYGAFEEDALNASVFGSNNQIALMTMDRCGWR